MSIDRLCLIREGNALVDPGQVEIQDRTRTGSPTVTFLVSKGKILLVDPGCGPHIDQATEAKMLWRIIRGLTCPAKIDYIFLTHDHEDHGNLALYFKAPIITNQSGEIIPGVTSLHTPGHSPDHHSLSFFYHNKRIVVAGDAIINEDYLRAPNLQDRIYKPNYYSPSEIKQTLKSMEFLTKNADQIIPGHGRIFEL